MLIVLILPLIGCDSAPDQRLADLARQSVEQQARQTEQMAQQSQVFVQQSQRLTEAAQELVTRDAEARQELVQAQHQLHSGVAAERANVDRQREAMETERRELATQRGRDPIIAEAVQGVGVMLACLLPLVICLYVLRHLGTESTGDMALGELLVSEFTAERPLFLPSPSPGAPRFTGRAAIEGADWGSFGRCDGRAAGDPRLTMQTHHRRSRHLPPIHRRDHEAAIASLKGEVRDPFRAAVVQADEPVYSLKRQERLPD